VQFCNKRNLLGPEKLIQLVAEYSGFTEVEVSITPLLINRKNDSCNCNTPPPKPNFPRHFGDEGNLLWLSSALVVMESEKSTPDNLTRESIVQLCTEKRGLKSPL
jgi:hypothetical protein